MDMKSIIFGMAAASVIWAVINDVASTSGKNKKAKELGIPVISEDEFVEKFGR